jgi:hypothetical protein
MLHRTIFTFIILIFSNFLYATYEVFPLKEQLFIREDTSPNIEPVTFEKNAFAENYTIRVYNGGVYGEFEKVEYSSVSSAKVYVNDILLFAPSDFNKNITVLEKAFHYPK